MTYFIPVNFTSEKLFCHYLFFTFNLIPDHHNFKNLIQPWLLTEDFFREIN